MSITAVRACDDAKGKMVDIAAGKYRFG